MNSLPSRPVSRVSSLLACLLLPLLLVWSGCGERTLDIGVSLITTSCPNGEGQVVNALDNADFLEFVVTGDGLSKPLSYIASVGEGQATIPEVPLISESAEVRRKIEVKARVTSPVGPVVARGAAVVDVANAEGSIDVPIFVRWIDGFDYTASAASPGTCSQMNRARSGHTATVLRDGRVLIVGGAIVDGSDERVVVASAEIYDPTTGEFTLLEGEAAPKQPRVYHTATLLQDGRVLVAGGEYDPPGGGGTQANKSAEIFDPVTNTFQSPIVLPRARTRHTATAVAGGMVLLAGGYTDPNPPPGRSHPVPTNTTDIFHGNAGSAYFSEGVELPEARAEHCAVLTANGRRVVLAGGKTLSGDEVVVSGSLQYLRAWIEDQRFSTVQDSNPGMRTPRYGLACGVSENLAGGEQLVMAGGYRLLDSFGQDSALAGVELFDPSATQAISELGSLPGGARGDLCSVQLDGEVVFIGGYNAEEPGVSPAADRLRREETGPTLDSVRGSMNDGRFFHQCALLRDGSVLVTGGQNDAGTGEFVSLPTAEVFTPLREEG